MRDNIWSFKSISKIILCLFVILISLTYCAAKPKVISQEDEKEILRNRIKEYWQYRVDVNKVNVEKAYQCEVPAFREKVSILEYVNQFKLVKYLEADISTIEIEKEKAKASINLTYRVPFPAISKKNLSKVEEERWVKIQKVWYHIPQGFEM